MDRQSMQLKVFNFFFLLILIQMSAISALATSCVAVTPAQELAQSQWGATNFLYKGFYFGLIFSTFLGNEILLWLRTRRLRGSLLLLVLSLPIALIYSLWEGANSECGYGGLEANNYLFVLIPLSVALVSQIILLRRSIQVIGHDLE